MAVITEAYNSLPSLREAGAKFQEAHAETQVLGAIRRLFIDYDVHEKYGLALLHKHFPIDVTERLVEYGSSATAWKIDSNEPFVALKYEGHVIPRSYRFMEKNAVPYEFAFTDKECQAEVHSEFFQALRTLLHQIHLQNLFGVRLLDTHDPNLTLEVTEGRTNIMMPRGSVSDSALTEALWVFGKGEEDRCHCREVCFSASSGHSNDHSCG